MAEPVNETRIRRQIAQRLSLRAPQENALTILGDVLAKMDFAQTSDLVELLKEIQGQYPSVQSFERDFPSLCFALATGVGKTRLMGAFIAFLYLTGRSKNFFVLAPNTTIYNKLVDDFSKQSSPKYVFRGIAEFAQTPPIIVTGDTWQEGRGIRGSDLFGSEAIINIFNVDKINKETGKIRSFRETLGDSYFDYLSKLPDLVMLMDEAHRYRAKAGANAIYELDPKLGLELTATPKTVGASPKDFKNVIYNYGLGNAMADGFVKEPAVATRADFRASDYDAQSLERIMLEDGVHYHEHVKNELELYSRETGRRRVYPFMLVVAQDTKHAKDLRDQIESDDFFAGAYKGRVIEVHSNLKGEESDEAMQRLVTLEHAGDTDIVIHVNKLKEGWDVTNLYTIVPLRASASDILTEQTLGRGLRLPYGERTGNEAVDTLTVIAHDRFDEVIKKAREADSLVQIKEYRIGNGGDISTEPETIIKVEPKFVSDLTGTGSELPAASDSQPKPPIFTTKEERQAVATTIDIIRDKYERQLKGGVNELQKPEVQQQIAKDVQRLTQAQQGTLEGIVAPTDFAKVVAAVVTSIAENTIEIPEIVILPSREVNFWFEDFDLTGISDVRLQPISDKLLIRNLRDESQRELARALEGPKESQVENYLVKHLMDYPQVDYDTQADLLYKLAGQMIDHLRSYLPNEQDVENVALAHGKMLAQRIFAQMKLHYRETPADYQASKTRSFRTLQPQHYSHAASKLLPLTQAATPLSATPSFVFQGGAKSPYQFHKFDSDPERRFAVLIDSAFEKDVLRWLKPGYNQFRIEYQSGKRYEPDFVVETVSEKLIVEIKAENQMTDPVVQDKARAAKEWVKHANQFVAEGDGKTWRYALISDQAINESATLAGLLAKFGSH
ncbi:DEAD/DEAH box helicase family protein [Novosphingobium arvoryzae]|uniref:Type III restriction endonuclease subunit R n=1 Tax=Novosphingobium arvoryzae TaxID=1256514 RepID=A0A918RC65_9SPHN|nr:DEAD/DEAH box helicase family protein [Novosphingobium arvoryzae]GGZ93414.1 type III restriction endonuclease subunit R [Novosphingobium arvoryzae]